MKWLMGLGLGIILVFFMRDLAQPGLPMFHDSNPHISRMIAFHTALGDGQFPPMWAKEVLGGIGSPVMMLNYQLPYMIGESIVRMGVSTFDSYKLTLALSFVVSGLLMYLALRSQYGLLSAWVGALIYTLAPYRFVDIYVRGALGESLSFIFPPLLIWGYNRRSTPLLILGWAGLFLTHPVASAVFSAFFLGYTLILKQKFNWSAYAIALLIATFNLIPTLALTKYTYYSPALSDTMLMFPTLSQLIHSPWGYGTSIPGINDGMSFEVGIIGWMILLWGVVMACKNKNKLISYLVASVLVALFFILPISLPIYRSGLGDIIDFPWRLLMCVVFGTAWMGAHLISNLKWQISNVVACVITIVLVLQSLPMAHTDQYWPADRDIEFFARETGDSYGEYAPLTRETRDSAPFWERAEFVRGSGEIETIADKSNQQKYKITTDESGQVRINTAYFPGWVIPKECRVSSRTLSHIDDSGLILCDVFPGESILEIKFVAPPVQQLGNLITLAGIGAYLWILCRSFYPHITSAKRSSKT